MSSDRKIKKESQTKVNPRKRRSVDEDIELARPEPVAVLTQLNKMSIYGPKFDHGPMQLRKNRLEAKWRKEKEMKREADLAMARKIAELAAAQKEAEDRAMFDAIADRMQYQAKEEELAKQAMEAQQAQRYYQQQQQQQQQQYYGYPSYGNYQYVPQQFYQPYQQDYVSYGYGINVNNNNEEHQGHQFQQQYPTDLHNNKL